MVVYHTRQLFITTAVKTSNPIGFWFDDIHNISIGVVMERTMIALISQILVLCEEIIII
jgi:hypothetical protein